MYNYLCSVCSIAGKIQAQKPAAASSKSEKKKNTKKEAEEEDVVNPETPLGEKKKLSRQMANGYHPKAVENS